MSYLNRHYKRRAVPYAVIFSLFLLLLSLVFLVLSRTTHWFAPWYATAVHPLLQVTVGRAFSGLPFSAFELALYLGGLLLLYGFFKLFFSTLKGRKSVLSYIRKSAVRTLLLASCLLLMFTMAASINYSRTSFAKTSGLFVETSSVEELAGLAALLIEDIKELEAFVPFDDTGFIMISKEVVKEETIIAMKRLGGRYPVLSGYYPDPKPILLSRHLSYLGITGIFSPFTMEANYNNHIPGYAIPYTINHELAHFKGFMKEDEAGFIAYLACRDSDSPVLKYSGSMNALSYTLSSLYRSAGPEEFATVYHSIPKQSLLLLEYNRNYWQAHAKPITHIAEVANHQYLLANAQAGGRKSYGGMVDLLLAEYAHILKQDTLL